MTNTAARLQDLISSAAVAMALVAASSCGRRGAPPADPEAADQYFEAWLVAPPTPHLSEGEAPAGRALAEAYCQRCHLFPAPDLLPQRLWREHVLPEMGLYLGMQHAGYDYGDRLVKDIEPAEREIWSGEQVYPEAAMMTAERWQTLMNWYLETAPAELDPPRLEVGADKDPPPGFLTTRSGLPLEEAYVSWVGIDPERREILFSEAKSGLLAIHDIGGGTAAAVPLGHAVVDCTLHGDPEDRRYRILSVGSLPPSDQRRGVLFEISRTDIDKGGNLEVDAIAGGLGRPVDFVSADLLGDSRPELVIAEYGNKTGRTSLFRAAGDGRLRQFALLDTTAGARRLAVRDINLDGRDDVLLLRGQGAEGISIYYNRGDGGFAASAPINYPPAYGTTDFFAADLDGDGLEDLVTANGDNADRTYVTKPYHGVRLWLGRENGRFEQSAFFPMAGAGGLAAADFDEDGDVDFFAISQFPDWDRPDRAPVQYFQNSGDATFSQYGVPESTGSAWMRVAAGDVDGDGDTDLVAGTLQANLANPPAEIRRRWEQAPPQPLLVLINTLRGATP